MKMYICVFALMLWSVVVNAQNKTCYKFTVAEKRYVDSAKLFYPGMENEFRYCREYLCDTIFREQRLFSKDTLRTSSTFKVSNNNWFVLIGKKWSPFYLKGKRVNPVIKISGLNYRLQIKTIYHKDGNTFIQYILNPAGDFTSSVHPIYTFTPSKGIIMITRDGTVLIRDDLKYEEYN
ncbi:hypothetical protein [Chitinophaga sancti]|uniref:Uncharacterized protein n=1 Tax=Chitinophaga sancti TaxID=1004 RepID=A0A1K1R4W2_9BACT|nr:hypothetical protein [Chitinophaga sancti]WQD64272.1 hypothetical protein U0033_07685 [Chitinophaga sancti]WQG90104.1 hypothetical protein SR876_01235 [Chitinophaga sancti]SFW66891.1 hypothetical protein SAMN05661012_03371 [Chitinophaga sancti]